MSRVIKFRAWNAATNAMHHNCDVSGGCAYAWKNPPKETVEATVSTVDGKINLYSDWAIQVKRPDLALMQFTGLTDCNGVEIYEGDICKIQFDDGKSCAMEVIYRAPRFLLQGDGFWSLDSYNVKFEVIGNIYQNPELLNNHSSA